LDDNQEWNINKGFGDLLIGLIEQVNKAAYDGNILEWFNALRILYRNVAGHKRMDAQVIKEINEDMLELRPKIDRRDPITEQGRAVQKVEQAKIKAALDEINIKMIAEMHQAGLILPVKIDTRKAIYKS
jgi:hypothetical protein